MTAPTSRTNCGTALHHYQGLNSTRVAASWVWVVMTGARTLQLSQRGDALWAARVELFDLLLDGESRMILLEYALHEMSSWDDEVEAFAMVSPVQRRRAPFGDHYAV